MVRSPKFFKYSLIVLAMGVSLQAWRDHSETAQAGSIEQYWTDTGVSTTALLDLIDDQTCSSSERYFLACANALVSMAGRYNLQVSVDGKLIPARGSDATSEREILAPWKRFFTEQNDKAVHLSFVPIWKDLDSHYIKNRERSMVIGAGLNGFISVFRDPHTYLMPIAFYREVVSKADSKSASLGVILGRLDKKYFIRKIFAGAPAEKAGLHKGDILVDIGGVPVGSVLPAKLNEMMRGEIGQTVHIGISRQGEEKSFAILREQSTIPTVTMRILEGLRPVGVLTINKFARQTCERTKEAIHALVKQNIRGLLLDLRDNPGGQMEEAACVASLFVGPDVNIFEIRYLSSDRDNERVSGSEEQAYKGPLAILINSGSASAAEIVAGALRDLNRGILVGETSFGKGSFQEGEVWTQNKKIALFETKGFYYLPSGRSPQMKGLEPDVRVAFKDTLQVREVDQFVNPLRAPEIKISHLPAHLPLRFSFNNCLGIEDGLTNGDDPELGRARQALFCANASVAGVSQ